MIHLSMANWELAAQRATSLPLGCCFWSCCQEENLLKGMTSIHHAAISFVSSTRIFELWTMFLLQCSFMRKEEQYLAKWASTRLHDNESLEQMVDPAIKRTFSSKALSRYADIISLCTQVLSY